VLLDILSQNKMSGEKIFTDIFQHNSPQLILQFLDNETSFFNDLKNYAQCKHARIHGCGCKAFFSNAVNIFFEPGCNIS